MSSRYGGDNPMKEKKVPTERDTFEKKPKQSRASVPKRKSKKEDKGVFTETEGEIKIGGLRKALNVDKDYKFTKSDLSPLLKHEEGKKFMFQGKSHTMTAKLKKQIRLAINMISS